MRCPNCGEKCVPYLVNGDFDYGRYRSVLSNYLGLSPEQFENFNSKPRGIIRDINHSDYFETEQITIISGIRRCGKSTLLSQFASNFKDFHYLNFDDERLISFKVEDFQNLLIIWHKRSNSKVLFLGTKFSLLEAMPICLVQSLQLI